ncbi:glycosyltransferase 87 family protein [Kineococcus rhizosphaerae]|uniref:glycosyltransferase 87 family protein n=1 Tax=Kineococcus rhizosphaerae TaxID=559628 RepID=UPI0014735F4E|nr:glycosyltransferase 87 family protein [Kineococcus rhizosphaerae]
MLPGDSLLHVLLRHRFLLIGLVAVGVVVSNLATVGPPDDWWYYQLAGGVFTGQVEGTAPWEFYRAHPDVWIGPLPLLLLTPLSLLPNAVGGSVVAVASGLALPLVCRAAERLARAPHPLVVLGAGVLAAPAWVELATTFTHPEDIGVVLGSLLALWAVQDRRPVVLGLAVGLAASGKPWAVGLLALSFVPVSVRRWQAPVTALAATALPWAAFVAVPGTVEALTSSTARVFAESPLALAGFAGDVYPSTVRLTQFALCFGLVALAARRRRIELALFSCVAARLLLEPQVWDYHWASLVAGAVLADVGASGRRVPWTTATCFIAFQLSRQVLPELIPWAQCVPVVTALVLLALPAARRGPRPSLPRQRTGVQDELISE